VQAEDLLRRTEKAVEDKERQWLEELVEARLQVMERRADLEAKERDLDPVIEPWDPRNDGKLDFLGRNHAQVAQELDEARKTRDKDNGKRFQQLSMELETLQEQLQDRAKDLEKEAVMRRTKRREGLAALRPLRRELLIAEEKLKALQPRVEWRREEARRDLEEQAQRVRQVRQALDEGDTAVPPSGHPVTDTDRKLDQLLRELAELRRALQPAKEKRPEEP
jgi:hypothetical protein